MNTFETLVKNPRVTVRKTGAPDSQGDCVVYWMQRAQRAIDNPALDVAVHLGNELRKPIVVFFAPVPFYRNANLRHFSFLANGISDIAEGLARRGVGFVFRTYPMHNLLRFCGEVRPAIVVGDENPTREAERWRSTVKLQIRVPFWTVDADVIVPTKLLGREHYAARTIRPRLHELIPGFLQEPDNPVAQLPWVPQPRLYSLPVDADFTGGWTIDRSVQKVETARGGGKQAAKLLRTFVEQNLNYYPDLRNRPEMEGTSRLSPYLHFGHIGPHTIALAIQNSDAPAQAKQAFLEQLIVRRELAVNFVRFNPSYDSMECVESWAHRSLAEHTGDPRPIVYRDGQLDNAETHDPLWNAAHKQMVLTGWMHNFLRMYWAKKILEWSPSIAIAFQRAVLFNDRYELDGRDPNGYAGIAWSIVGKHDRAWPERPVFGKIRYMSAASTGRKFNSRKYIADIAALESGRLVAG